MRIPWTDVWTHTLPILIFWVLLVFVLKKAILTFISSHSPSRKKSKNAVIGNNFGLYVGGLLENDGWRVNYHGIKKGRRDGGVDLICEKDGATALIQCKYKSDPNGYVNENAIDQLFGALNAYKHENPGGKTTRAMIVTTGRYSADALRKAKIHGIELIDNRAIPELKSRFEL